MSGSLGGNKGSSSSSSTSTTTGKKEDWLLGQIGDKLGGLLGGALDKYTPTDKEHVGLNEWQQQALQGLVGGNKDIWNQFTNAGSGAIQGGLQGQQGAMQGIGDLFKPGGILTAEGIYDKAQGLVNTDLVKSQHEALNRTVNEGLAGANQAINQKAASSGGMGSSRAGVAQGVAQGKAATALAEGSQAITGAATDKAMQQAMDAAKQQLGGLSNIGTIGGNLLGQGGNLLGSGAAGGRQDLLDMLQSGNIQQSDAEKKMQIDKWNEMVKKNPSMAALGELGPLLMQFAGLGGTSTSTTTGKNQGSSSSSNSSLGFNIP